MARTPWMLTLLAATVLAAPASAQTLVDKISALRSSTSGTSST